MRALAGAAQTSTRALAQLRALREVDGRPFELARALRTADAADLRARLRTLAAGGATTAPPFVPRTRARSILGERRFHASPVPRPFHRPLVWLRGDRASLPVRMLAHELDRIATRLVALLIVRWRHFERDPQLVQDRAPLRGGRGEQERRRDPRALERAADEAEAAGDAARALRLRFRAGLLRLGRADVVPLRESLTSGEARRIIRLRDFDGLARTHDEVVYGGRAARREDAVAAREHWPRVLEAKGVRT